MSETPGERLERREREIRESFEQCHVCFYQPASDCIVAECPWRKPAAALREGGSDA